VADQRGGGITWCDETWNVVRGCSRVSPGCNSCYAERQAMRMSGPGGAYEGLVEMTRLGPRWTGEVRLIPELLDQPKRWTKPRLIFVNAMSDLFHEGLKDEEIFEVFKAMAAAPQHVFQVLTKRADRMRDLIPKIRRHLVDRLDHVWLGVSVENQVTAEDRIPELLDTPAMVKWLSVEPLIGPVSIAHFLPGAHFGFSLGISWVVVGGESGPNARPMHPDWARRIRSEVKGPAGRQSVNLHFKQWGQFRPVAPVYADDSAHLEDGDIEVLLNDRDPDRLCAIEPSGSIPIALGSFGRAGCQPAPGSWWMEKMRTKEEAGRELDGRTWDEFPKGIMR
jgi:protein gp37